MGHDVRHLNSGSPSVVVDGVRMDRGPVGHRTGIRLVEALRTYWAGRMDPVVAVRAVQDLELAPASARAAVLGVGSDLRQGAACVHRQTPSARAVSGPNAA
jgi:hypothetical protein